MKILLREGRVPRWCGAFPQSEYLTASASRAALGRKPTAGQFLPNPARHSGRSSPCWSWAISLRPGTGVGQGGGRRSAGCRRLRLSAIPKASTPRSMPSSSARSPHASPRPTRSAGSGSRTEALAVRLDRTGKKWSVSQYIYVSAGIALAIAVLIFLQSGALLLALGVGMFVGAGLPHLVVGFFISRRTNAFVTKFPDAIELLVRGLRSGLPVTETLGVVAQEVPGPVGVEFRSIVDRIKVGKTMEDSLQDTADRLGIPEFNFFTITLAIQRETGGNLAETLSNLADVLRKRGQMKLKIKANEFGIESLCLYRRFAAVHSSSVWFTG